MRPTNQLVNFLTETMSMADIYQPAIILHLLMHGGSSKKEDLAKTLSGYDYSVQEFYEKVLMRWPKTTLTKHGVVTYDRKEKTFSLGFDLKDKTAFDEAITICEKKIAEWIQKKIENDPSGGVDASKRYRVLKAARGRCELCGISSKLSAIDIDHIVPRSQADKKGFVLKDGIRLPLDDEHNLQALCFRCNRAKRDKDQTDFRISQKKLVRDKIPEIIRCSGRIPVTRIVKGQELFEQLQEKLLEEHVELLDLLKKQNAGGNTDEVLDEIVDLIEVLFALAKQLGLNETKVLEWQKNKRENKGGYDCGLFLTQIHSE